MKHLSLGLIALTSVMTLLGCSKPELPEKSEAIQPVKVVRMEVSSGEKVREFPGTVRASQRVELSFQVPGRLQQLSAKEGQLVKEGQVIGVLDQRDYTASFNAAKAELATSDSNYQRALELVKQDFISQADVDKLKAAFEGARSGYEKAEKALSDTTLTAPFSGAIARRHVENFEDVLAKQTIISLQDNNNLEVVVDISETLIARREGHEELSLKARFDAFPQTQFELFVKEFVTEADPLTQTFRFVLGIQDTKSTNLLPGMTANVIVERTDDDGVQRFALPLTALVAGEGDAKAAWVVSAEGIVSKRVIEVGGLMSADKIEVTSGLNLGDQVIVAGTGVVRDGLKVKPVTEVLF